MCLSITSSHTHVNTACTLTFVSLILPLSLLSRLLLFRDELLTTGTGCTSSSPHQSELKTQPIWVDGPWTLRTCSSSSSTSLLLSSLLLSPSVSCKQAPARAPGQLFLSAGEEEREALPLFLALVQLRYRDRGKDMLCMLSLPPPLSFYTHTLKNTSPLSNSAAVTCRLVSLLFCASQ